MPRPTKRAGMRRATRHDAATDRLQKTPTDRLSRGLLTLHGAHAALRTASLGTAAIACNASRAPGCGSRALTDRQLRSSAMVSVSQHPRRRACWELFYCSRIQARYIGGDLTRMQQRLHARADTPIPSRGFERACEHNARSIMRNPLNAALRAALERGLFGCRPHNVRYVRCTRSERRRSL